jgi:hypothetical protein
MRSAVQRPPLPRHRDHEALADNEVVHLQARPQHDVAVPLQHDEDIADLDQRAASSALDVAEARDGRREEHGRWDETTLSDGDAEGRERRL